MDRCRRKRGRRSLEALTITSSSQVEARSLSVLDHRSRTTERASSSASHIRETRNILAEAVSRLDHLSNPSSSDSSQSSDQHSRVRQQTRSTERLDLFRSRPYTPFRGQRSKKKRNATWLHEFVCLSSATQTVPPTPLERAELMQAGLGLKSISFLDCSDSDMFHQDLLEAFPKLEDGGGYELLRTAEKNSRLLDVIPPPPSGYSASYVKIVAGQAKIYIRPLQQNLSLTTENKDTVFCPHEKCKQCGDLFLLSTLKDHITLCKESASSLEIPSPVEGSYVKSPSPPEYSPICSPFRSPSDPPNETSQEVN